MGMGCAVLHDDLGLLVSDELSRVAQVSSLSPPHAPLSTVLLLQLHGRLHYATGRRGS